MVVTGAGHGLGRAAASQFVREGAHVVAVDVVATGVEELAAELGDPITPITASVADVADIDRVIDAAVSASPAGPSNGSSTRNCR